MIKSSSSMTRLMNRALALVFFVLVFVSSFQSISAAVTAPNCSALTISPTTVTPATTSIHVSFNSSSGISDDTRYDIVYGATGQQTTNPFDRNSGTVEVDFAFSFNDILSAPQEIYIRSGSQKFCETNIVRDPAGDFGRIGQPGSGVPATSFDLCQQAGSNRAVCDQCMSNGQIWTGMGCIPFSTHTGTVQALITLGLGITGTVVVLMTIYAGFMFSTSQGDPKRVDEAKSAMTSAIIGAFFIIFSVTILRFIGITLLHIPGFG